MRCSGHPGPTLCDTLPRTAAKTGSWPKKGVPTPVCMEAQGKVSPKDIQARTGIYRVPKQVDSARG